MKDGLRFLNIPGAPSNCPCDILDKHKSHFDYVQYMLDRTNRMFTYDGLPDTIPAYMLEYMLQVFGAVAVSEVNGDLYAFRAEQGGPPDPYYRSTIAIVANPGLGVSKMYRIANHLPPFDRANWDTNPECVIMRNDTAEMGLLPMFSRYATQMSENDISIRCAQINLRSQHIIAANTGSDIESAQKFMRDLEDGKLSAIATRPFLEGVSVTPAGTPGNPVMQLLELQQYLRASWYNEIGLNSNFNMKSQYLSETELNSTADAMVPLVDDMLECREAAVEHINRVFGTAITVRKDSAWRIKDMELGAALENGGDVEETEDIIQNGMEDVEIAPPEESGGDTEETIIEQDIAPESVEEPAGEVVSALEAVAEIVSDIADMVSPDGEEGGGED